MGETQYKWLANKWRRRGKAMFLNQCKESVTRIEINSVWKYWGCGRIPCLSHFLFSRRVCTAAWSHYPHAHTDMFYTWDTLIRQTQIQSYCINLRLIIFASWWIELWKAQKARERRTERERKRCKHKTCLVKHPGWRYLCVLFITEQQRADVR